ncbi:MAG: hypothetical protein WBQ24_17625, partial [Xanthobacteraceae bacterium]
METATVCAPFWAAVDAAMGASSSKIPVKWRDSPANLGHRLSLGSKSGRFRRFSYPLTIITLNRSSGCGQDGSSTVLCAKFAAQNRRAIAGDVTRVATGGSSLATSAP